MSSLLKQSTTVTIKMGPFLDATSGVDEETGLTPGIEVSKAGGAFGARNSATAVAHDAEGYYNVELDDTDTATLGRLVVKAHDSATHLPVWHEFQVVPANVYDSLIAGSDTLDVNATSATVSGTVDANITEILGTSVTETTSGRLAGNLSTLIDNGDADSSLTLANVSTLTTAQVNSEVDTAIETYGLDHLVSSAVVGADVTDNSIIAKIVSQSGTADWDDFDNTTDSLEAIGSKAALITSTTALTVNNISDGDTIDLTQGGARKTATGNAIILAVDGTVSGQDYTGYTPKLGLTKLVSTSGDATLEVSGTVTGGGTAGQQLVFELDTTDTATLAIDDGSLNLLSATTGRAYRYTISVTNGTGNCADLARGEVSVKSKDTSC